MKQIELIAPSARLSVLMSVYNAQKYLATAADSILNQTFRDFTFIIIDDGSTDSSLKMLRDYERRDRRIQLVSRPNTGLVGALNEALSMANGEFIARMDGDDISLPDRFARQIQFLDKNPDYSAVGCHCLWTDPAGLPLKVFPQPSRSDDINAELLRGNGNAIVHAASMYRRADLTAIGGYRQQYETAEDIDLFLRLSERGKLANLTDTLYVYRQHFASVNHARGEQQDDAVRRAVEDARLRRMLPVNTELVPSHPRPRNKAEFYHRWMEFAMEGENYQTARKYARRLALLEPWSKRTWRPLAKCYLPTAVWRAWCASRQRTFEIDEKNGTGS